MTELDRDVFIFYNWYIDFTRWCDITTLQYHGKAVGSGIQWEVRNYESEFITYAGRRQRYLR